MPNVTLYRSASPVWRARSATICVDGSEAGTLRAKDRLTLDLDDGPHQLTARIGLTTSPALTVILKAQLPTLVAIRANLIDRTISPPTPPLTLAVVQDFDDHGVSYRDMYQHRPIIGYRRRSHREQLAWVLGFLLLIAGQIVTHTVGRLPGLLIEIPGIVLVIVIFIRLFIYRGNGSEPNR